MAVVPLLIEEGQVVNAQHAFERAMRPVTPVPPILVRDTPTGLSIGIDQTFLQGLVRSIQVVEVFPAILTTSDGSTSTTPVESSNGGWYWKAVGADAGTGANKGTIGEYTVGKHTPRTVDNSIGKGLAINFDGYPPERTKCHKGTIVLMHRLLDTKEGTEFYGFSFGSTNGYYLDADAIDMTETGEGTEAADTNSWDINDPQDDEHGVKMTIQTRTYYDHTATTPVLYGYGRVLHITTEGQILSISAETRYTIDTPEECDPA